MTGTPPVMRITFPERSGISFSGLYFGIAKDLTEVTTCQLEHIAGMDLITE